MASAVVVTKFGGYDSLQVQTLSAIPTCKPEEVRVNIKACGMNFADIYLRQGAIPGTPKPPFVLGLEAAGVVDSVGENVTSFKSGDRVLCYSPLTGMMASTVCLPAAQCFSMPETMSFQEGAAILINYGTAHCALFGLGGLRPNQVVFIHSIAGGVGCAVIQLAKTVPGVRVVGTASAGKHEKAQNVGADRVFDYADYKEQLSSLYPQGVDVFIDNRSGSEFTNALQLIRPMGKLIHIGATSVITGEKRNIFALVRTWWGLKRVSVFDLMSSNTAVCGLNLTQFYKNDPTRFRETIDAILVLYNEGVVKPQIDSTWNFNSVREATERMTNRQNVGKLIIVPFSSDENSDASDPKAQ